MMRWSGAIFLVLSLSCLSLSKDLPKGWPTCKRNDPNIGDCMLAATESLREELLDKGAPEFHFPSIRNFFIPLISIQQEINKNIVVDMVNKNTTVKGLETYKFTKFTFNPETLMWFGHVNFDHLNLVGQLEVNGKLFGNNLNERGGGNIQILKPSVDFIIEGKIITKKGQEYYHIENFKTTLAVDPKEISIIEVTGIRQPIIDSFNQILSDSEGGNLNSLLRTAETVVSDIMKALIGSIPDRVPYDTLFPPV